MADEHSSQALGPNEWLVDEMYEQYLADPSSVSQSWQEFFADYRREEKPPAPPPAPEPEAATSPTDSALRSAPSR
jgi:multifunctional 2-oxoglutarate metabolism enzyme